MDSEETEEWAVWYDESHSQTLNLEQFDELALEVGRVQSYDDMRQLWNSMVHINGKPQTWSNTPSPLQSSYLKYWPEVLHHKPLSHVAGAAVVGAAVVGTAVVAVSP